MLIHTGNCVLNEKHKENVRCNLVFFITNLNTHQSMNEKQVSFIGSYTDLDPKIIKIKIKMIN